MNNGQRTSERAILFLSPMSDQINDGDVSLWPQGPSLEAECVVVPERLFYQLTEAVSAHITTQDLSDKFDISFVTFEEEAIFDTVKVKLFSELCYKAAAGLDFKKTGLVSDRKHDVIMNLLYSISTMCSRAALRGSGLIIYT